MSWRQLFSLFNTLLRKVYNRSVDRRIYLYLGLLVPAYSLDWHTSRLCHFMTSLWPLVFDYYIINDLELLTNLALSSPWSLLSPFFNLNSFAQYHLFLSCFLFSSKWQPHSFLANPHTMCGSDASKLVAKTNQPQFATSKL